MPEETLFENDYPAAHSMDTTWWGVDRDGHIARFDTGEAGAAPEEAGEGSHLDVMKLISTAKIPFVCDDLFPIADRKIFARPDRFGGDEKTVEPTEVTAEYSTYLPSLLLWLADEAALKKIKKNKVGKRAVTLNAPGKVVVWLYPDYDKDYGDSLVSLAIGWRDEGLVLRGWLYGFGDLELDRLGIFHYDLEHFDNWIAGPLTRGGIPAHPLKLDDLPAKMRESLDVVSLEEADFARDVMFQPYEHGDAVSWDPHWVSSTGRILDGDEEEEEEEPSPSIAALSESHPMPAALLAAYLSGEEGASSVLGDWLSERGRSPLHDGESIEERLDEVLHGWCSAEQRLALEARLVEHALTVAPPGEGVATAVSAVLDAVRRQIDGHDDPTARAEAANAAFAAWMPEGEEMDGGGERSRLAWAAWALGMGYPLVCARTLRTMDNAALAHQIALVLEQARDTV